MISTIQLGRQTGELFHMLQAHLIAQLSAMESWVLKGETKKYAEVQVTCSWLTQIS